MVLQTYHRGRRYPVIQSPATTPDENPPRSIRLDWVLARVVPISLFLTFVVVSVDKLVVWVVSGNLAIDLRIYRAAAEAGLRGLNPWDVAVGGYYFAAPPPSLLPYVPA